LDSSPFISGLKLGGREPRRGKEGFLFMMLVKISNLESWAVSPKGGLRKEDMMMEEERESKFKTSQ